MSLLCEPHSQILFTGHDGEIFVSHITNVLYKAERGEGDLDQLKAWPGK